MATAKGLKGCDWTTDLEKPVRSKDYELYPSPAKLQATLTRKDGKSFGAYYVKIDYLGDD